jgi:hypothetical protein
MSPLAWRKSSDGVRNGQSSANRREYILSIRHRGPFEGRRHYGESTALERQSRLNLDHDWGLEDIGEMKTTAHQLGDESFASNDAARANALKLFGSIAMAVTRVTRLHGMDMEHLCARARLVSRSLDPASGTTSNAPDADRRTDPSPIETTRQLAPPTMRWSQFAHEVPYRFSVINLK